MSSQPQASGQSDSCPNPLADASSGSSGVAQLFLPDPMAAAGNVNLAPTSLNLDNFRQQMPLDSLGGHAVLEGKYVDIRSGLCSAEGYSAFSSKNDFEYVHADPRFQEAMTYYYGNAYRKNLDQSGYLQPLSPVKIVVHCQDAVENAFFERRVDNSGQVTERVCLGDSAATPGASYADDSVVSVHELQHATTMDTYGHYPDNLNQLFYDEAGSLNEALSDFMSLVYEVPNTPTGFDPRLFSRWALGTFIAGHPNTRGAHKCPTYDPSYPDCGNFPAFSAEANTVSYVYPDGMGWPYANNKYPAPGYARSAFISYHSQEEIHNAGVLMVGALWDVYDAVRVNHGGDATVAQSLMIKLVMETLKHLPHSDPTSNLSPVTFRAFGSTLASYGSAIGLTDGDQSSLKQSLTQRGLFGGTPLPTNWAAVGPGRAASPGLKIQDNPTVLQAWLNAFGGDGTFLTQGISTGLNGQLDPGELVAVWFDIQDTADQSAGAIEVTVSSNDPEIVVLDGHTNVGALGGNSAQIQYQKINGNRVVSSLSSSNPALNVPTGNDYFSTNPFFDSTYRTAIWVRVIPTAAHGRVISFQVSASPSNGPPVVLSFPAKIN